MMSVFKTDQGKVRHHNEDNGGIFVNRKGDRLAVVADGMGGHKAGDVASKLAAGLLEERWKETDDVETPAAAEKWFADHVSDINQAIYEHALANKECEGMGTTLVGAICTERFATIVNIGDSRCYMLNESGFSQLTEDHSLVNELVKSGQISKEDAEHHPRKNLLLKAMGTEKHVDMDLKTITFEDGDMLLLCSDGLSNKLSGNEISDILSQPGALEAKADELIRQANQNGGEDNITIAIVEYAANPESGCEEC